MRMTPWASPIALPLLVLISLAGCTGQVFLRPEEEVTPGEALGFTDIYYTQILLSGPSDYLRALDISPEGRMTFRLYGYEVDPVFRGDGYLSDRELFQLKKDFYDSDFFALAAEDTSYGEYSVWERQTISYQVGDQNEEIVRYQHAEVPPQLEVLFDKLEKLVGGWYGWGGGNDALAVSPYVVGTSTRIDNFSFFVIKSQDSLLDLLWRMGSIEVSVLPEIDFAREMLACVFLGDDIVDFGARVAGATYAIQFDPVAYTNDDAVRVKFVRHNRPADCVGAVRPFAIGRLPRSDLPVQFYEESRFDTTFVCE